MHVIRGNLTWGGVLANDGDWQGGATSAAANSVPVSSDGLDMEYLEGAAIVAKALAGASGLSGTFFLECSNNAVDWGQLQGTQQDVEIPAGTSQIFVWNQSAFYARYLRLTFNWTANDGTLSGTACAKGSSA